MFRDLDLAEEIVQDLFCKYWERRDSIRINESPKGYFIKAMKNRYFNVLEHEKVKMKAQQNFMESAEISHQELPAFDLQEKIREAYSLLPEQCHRIFRMSRERGMKYSEIAESLGLSVKTVENQMGKGLKIFRTHLREYLPLLILVGLPW
jgi:RNA polymerase sigma-19 factor, ECF subfamily